MCPSRLSQLCGKRYLGSDHTAFVASMLNKQQSDHHVCCLNYVGDLERYFSKEAMKSHKSIVFLLNIGRSGSKTFMGSDLKEGSHWSMATYSIGSNTLAYYDTCAWEIPSDLVEKVKKVTSILGVDSVITVKHAHDPNAHKFGGRSCGFDCLAYPLQSCGNVCGPITLVMASIFCLNNCKFMSLMSSYDDFYLRKPTEFNGFLRLKLASWYCYGKIDVHLLFPDSKNNALKTNQSLKSTVTNVSQTNCNNAKADESLESKQETLKHKETLKNVETSEHNNAENSKPVVTSILSDCPESSKTVETSDSKKFTCPACPTTFTKKVSALFFTKIYSNSIFGFLL